MGAVMYDSDRSGQPVSPKSKSHMPLRLTAWIPFWDQAGAASSFRAHAGLFDSVSVFWYGLDGSGKITSYQPETVDPSVIAFAHTHHVKVLAVLANMSDNQWDAVRVGTAIGTAASRSTHIAEILKLLTDYGFDGVDIDYENLRPDQKDDFSSFIRELAATLHRAGKTVGVAVYPQSGGESDRQDGAGAQDLPSLARAADQLYVMTYLQHGLESDPGPSGSIPWQRQVLSHITGPLGVPGQKLYFGIGLMGIAWRADPGGQFSGDREDLTYAEVRSYGRQNSAVFLPDTDAGSIKLTFSDVNGRHILWYEDRDGILQRVELARQTGLAGVAFWRLGGEDDRIWTHLGLVLGK